jgi:hypothetical protein
MSAAPPEPLRVPEAQTASAVLMIRPAGFGANAETAATNVFQRDPRGTAEEILLRARAEFDALVAALRAHGVDVHVVEDTPEPPKPDAIFPNNWVSFHADGSAVLYPLLAPSRRAEVRPEVLSELARRGARAQGRIIDLRAGCGETEFLEGTGSLVLDRVHRVAYACLSPRTARAPLERFCRELAYEPFPFHAADARGVPIYHTNVMLSVGTRVAIACLESVRDARERRTLEERLVQSDHELVALSLAQMEEFAGNTLELRARDGRALFVLSVRALRALHAEQRARLERHGTLVSSELETIETHGGGSARCMLAELF